MQESNQALVGALAGDILGLAGAALGALGIPSNTISTAVTGYLSRRQDELREVILDELAAAKIDKLDAASQDDKIATTLRVMRAANEGAARINLRLLVKAITGQLASGRLVADEFLRFADILASLRHEEILLLAALRREDAALDGEKGEPVTMDPKERPYIPWRRAIEDRCGGAFLSEDAMHAVAGALQRTGLVRAASAYRGLTYRTTPLFAELVALVDFQDALRREGFAK